MKEILDMQLAEGFSLGSLLFGRLLPALLTLLVCLGAMKLLTALAARLLDSSRKLDGALKGFIRSAVKIALWLITAIIVADTLGIPTSSLVALVSVAGLALSLSVQNIMSNLFSGITLLMSRPFSAGDYVDIAGRLGTVRSVGLLYTVIATPDNIQISIPNADVTASAVTNYTSEPLRRVDMYFSASYDDPSERVRSAIMEALAGEERVLAEPAPFVGLQEYQSSSIRYVLRVWCKNADYWELYFALNEKVRESFEKNSVTMSYEHMNVHIIKDEG